MASSKLQLVLLSLLCFSLFSLSKSEEEFQIEVQDVGDKELRAMVQENRYVLVFFYLGTCSDEPKCASAMEEFEKVPQNAMIEGLKIAKVIDSELILDFNLKPLPKILFYRDGVPIMFDADHIEDQDIIIWMEQSRDSPVQILTDVSFEHLTQALSGATTGDWMIGFWSRDCRHIRPMWEAVGARIRHHMNIALVDVDESPLTAKRFRIKDCPTFIFLKAGKMYKYKSEVISVNALAQFAQGKYSTVTGKVIPDEVFEPGFAERMIGAVKGGSFAVIFGIIATVGVILLCCVKRRTEGGKLSKIA